MAKSNKTKSSKKKYETPKLFKHGSVRDFTRTEPTGGWNDKGIHPANRSTTNPHGCVGGVTEIEEHRVLLNDHIAQESFQKAIHETVQPGDVVLDLGTGSGIHALFAVQAGAKKVYAVDSSAIIAVAEEIAEENGMADKVEFVVGEFDDVEIPEKVDVIITHTGFLVTLAELPKAVKRWLKPGGRIVPGDIYLSFVPVDVSESYKDIIDFWNTDRYGLKFSAFRKYSASFPHTGHFERENFLATPVALPKFDLKEVPKKFEWEMTFQAEKSGFISGLLGWYTFNLSENVQITAEPPMRMQPELWKQPLLPMKTPVAVEKGQTITVQLQMYWGSLLYDEVGWKWRVEVDGETFENSNFESIPLNNQLLRKFQQ